MSATRNADKLNGILDELQRSPLARAMLVFRSAIADKTLSADIQ
jgi:hypothetical protein